MLNRKFKPTKQQVQAARLLFLAIAYAETVRPVVEGYQRKILAAHNWPMAQKWIDASARRRGDKYMNGEPILDPKDSFLLEDDASAIYFAALDDEAKAAGFKDLKPGYCPLLMAENVVRDAERALIDAMAEITKITNDNIWNLGYDKRNEYLELTKKLFAPFVKG